MILLIPECYVDTRIVNFFLIGIKGVSIRHQRGHGNVKNSGEINIGKYKKVIGFLDKFSDASKLLLLQDVEHSKSFIQKEVKGVHYIYITSTIEKFILACCAESSIDNLADYGFSEGLNESQFVKFLKSPAIENHSGFKKLISDLVENSPTMAELKKSLITLINSNF